ncbi:hypothetical protein [Solidesulfovibrio magneticus]|uniref:Uncharacterized protein n=1 Tax=Solidesulfovibrio magneticus (strain ATCC 700980 / DSM 13731 / RS-1) TaxID=573370 RepID=C4XT23_SOLM1|nr:hypothetical protein [Solidesulfovibrio magneticus]BAH73505.1 hypothetical protein DMR_00140 [Solidesulfovibrio magneticus RS-1]
MPRISPHFLELFDANGAPRGVLLSAELWERCKDQVLPPLTKALYVLDPAARPEPEVRPEPLQEWETLLAYWDFTYPPAYDVHCDCCGAATDDWRADEPRKFRLRNANLGGLVTFQCAGCKALVLKKHFKKHLTVECKPYVDKG